MCVNGLGSEGYITRIGFPSSPSLVDEEDERRKEGNAICSFFLCVYNIERHINITTSPLLPPIIHFSLS